MKLPVALKNQLEESERKYQKLLGRLGVSREELETLAGKIDRRKAARPAPSAPRPVAGKGRIFHV